MRGILHFATPFYPRKSGLGNYIMGLSSHLPTYYNSVVICCDTENTKNYRELYHNVLIYRLKCFSLFNGSYFIPSPLSIIKVFIELNNKSFFIIHTHTRFFLTSILGLLFSKVKKIPLVHVEHGSSFVQHENKLISFFSKVYDLSIGRFVLNRSDEIFCVSKNVKSFVEKMSKNKRIFVVSNGVDVSKFKRTKSCNTLIRKFKLPFNKIIITFVGRLIEGKGVQDLIGSFKSLDGAVLIIVGNGPYKKHLQNIAKENKNIIFLGEVDRDKVIDILSITDIFVNPSYTEGLPTSILESGCVGCPVIATNVGGTSEIIEDGINSFLFQKGNVVDLREKIIILMKDKSLRKKFAKRLKKNIYEKFDWKNITEEYIRRIENGNFHKRN